MWTCRRSPVGIRHFCPPFRIDGGTCLALAAHHRMYTVDQMCAPTFAHSWFEAVAVVQAVALALGSLSTVPAAEDLLLEEDGTYGSDSRARRQKPRLPAWQPSCCSCWKERQPPLNSVVLQETLSACARAAPALPDLPRRWQSMSGRTAAA